MTRSRWDALTEGSVRVPVNDTLGWAVVPLSDPRKSVSLSWTVPPEYCNSTGNLQGGIMAAFADAALGAAAAAHLPADLYPALVEMKISVFRPAPAGETLTATGRVLKTGRRVLFVEAEIIDSRGRPVAKASGTEVPANA